MTDAYQRVRQLAAISSLATGDPSAEEIESGHELWSAAFDDVLAVVVEVKRLREANKLMADALVSIKNTMEDLKHKVEGC